MKKSIVGLVVLVLILTILFGGGGYWYYSQSKLVTNELNEIVEIVNQSNNQSSDLQNQITEATLKLSERAEYEQTLQELNEIIPKSQEFIDQKQTKIDQINQTTNPETDALRGQAITAITVHSDALARSLEVASFSQCVATNLDAQFKWMRELGQSWEGTDETTSEVTFVQLNRQTATKLRENVDTAPRIRDCFRGQYSELFTLEFENSMKRDVSIYQNLADSMDKLAGSVESFDRNNFLAAKDEITATLSQESTFIGDTQLKIRDAIDKVATENTGEMRTQEELMTRAKDEVESKWWL